MLYLILKSLHVVAIISWLAGLLYLPRLMVYHCTAAPGGELSETLKVMERRLYTVIMRPAMLAAWIFGLGVAATLGFGTILQQGWFIAKLVLVVGLTAYHHMLGGWVRDFAADANQRPARFYRIANEVPTLVMILVVALVIIQPF